MKIKGVDVVISAFEKFKSLEALIKEQGEIFKHLGESEEEAYKALWDVLSPPKKDKEEKV